MALTSNTVSIIGASIRGQRCFNSCESISIQMPRIKKKTPASFSVGWPEVSRYDGWVHDISLSGMQLRTNDELSDGERQRAMIARTLAQDTDILLLDEPTANLDPVNTQRVERLVTDYLRRHQAACLWVTHAADQIERIASRALYLDNHGLAGSVNRS